MSLFSAACAAAACGSSSFSRAGWRSAALPALSGALTLAFGPSLWAEANVQRVYGLNLLFVALATAAAWRWTTRGNDRSLAAAFLVCGIGATNHTFMAVFAAALFVHAAVSDPALVRRPLRLALCACAFAPGLLPYLYLPLRSRMNPRLDWGNPETLGNFLTVVLRRGFWARRWLERPADLLPIAGDYFLGLGRELAWAGALLAIAGLAAWLWKRELHGVGISGA